MILAKTSSGETLLQPPDGLVQLPPFSTKRAMEFAHLQHFKRLIKVQHPDLQFSLIGDGTDPPDFILSRAGTQFGIELTVFASPERRERSAFFSKLHDRLIMSYDKGGLRGLSGIKVDISFGDLGGKPFEVKSVIFDELVASFEELAKLERPQISEKFVDAPSGSQWPERSIGIINWQVSGYSNQPLRGSKLSNRTGFEIEFTHREWLKPQDVADTMNERISSKDRPGNDELLIVAGGPDQSGRIFPAETMLVHHLLEGNSAVLTKPSHIKRVYVDIWGPERVYVVHES